MTEVLVVDDSALVREFLSEILNRHADIRVAEAVSNPYRAVEVLNSRPIDVITLDLEMPKMDGLTFLKKLMSQKPVPVIVVSSIAEEGSENAVKALQLGAVDVIEKPKLGLKDFLRESEAVICEKVLNAAKVNVRGVKSIMDATGRSEFTSPRSGSLLKRTTQKLIAIGASTGGTVTLRNICSRIPNTVPGIVVSQHMPEGFTLQFSKSLNEISSLEVEESRDGMRINIGTVHIARGNRHLEIYRSGAYYFTRMNSAPKRNRHRPSVDVMFESVAKTGGANVLGILLTGMGSDGAEGLARIREAGGKTIAQDEASSIVFGMPKAAIDRGAAQEILSIDDIINRIIAFGEA